MLQAGAAGSADRRDGLGHDGEEGVILDRRPGGYWGVRFSKGAFLMDSLYLEAVAGATISDSPESAT
ncbi:MAG: NAD(P)H dehydrogenase assembly family protein [Coleofasciculaceae cyanobacterium]